MTESIDHYSNNMITYTAQREGLPIFADINKESIVGKSISIAISRITHDSLEQVESIDFNQGKLPLR